MILSKGRSALGTSTATVLSRSTVRGISAKIVPSYCRGHTGELCCYCSGPPISRASAASPTSTHVPAAGSPRQIFHTRSGKVEFNLSQEVGSGSSGDAPLLPRVSGSCAGGARFKSTAAATVDLDVEISRDVVVNGSGDDGGGDSSSGLTSFRLTGESVVRRSCGSILWEMLSLTSIMYCCSGGSWKSGQTSAGCGFDSLCEGFIPGVCAYFHNLRK